MEDKIEEFKSQKDQEESKVIDEPQQTQENQTTKQENSNFKQKDVSCEVIFDHIQPSRFRVKQFLWMQVLNFVYTGGMALLVYLIYQALFNKSIKCFITLMILVAEPLLYGKRQGWACALARYVELHKWFNRFRIVAEEPIEKENVLFTWMPHTVFTFPLWMSIFLKQNYFNATVLASRMVCRFPIAGTLARWLGIEGVDAENFTKLMKQKRNINFVPGGFEEATVYNHNQYRLYNNNRKGFIKYALQYGYKVRPVFVFNERHGYWTNDMFMNLRLYLNKYKAPGALFFSKYGLIPHKRCEIVLVVGKNLNIPHIEKPTRDDVEKYFDLYKKEVQELFDRHVDQYDKGSKLVFYEDILNEKNQEIQDCKAKVD